MPSNISLGLSLGSLTAMLFFISNFVVISRLIHKVINTSVKWEWLDKLQNRWHKIHYFGNLASVILAIVHAILMIEYSNPLHWVSIALLVWMVSTGLIMRFSKASVDVKKKIRVFHAQWYMFLAVLLVLVIAHAVSLVRFPYVM